MGRARTRDGQPARGPGRRCLRLPRRVLPHVPVRDGRGQDRSDPEKRTEPAVSRRPLSRRGQSGSRQRRLGLRTRRPRPVLRLQRRPLSAHARSARCQETAAQRHILDGGPGSARERRKFRCAGCGGLAARQRTGCAGAEGDAAKRRIRARDLPCRCRAQRLALERDRVDADACRERHVRTGLGIASAGHRRRAAAAPLRIAAVRRPYRDYERPAPRRRFRGGVRSQQQRLRLCHQRVAQRRRRSGPDPVADAPGRALPSAAGAAGRRADRHSEHADRRHRPRAFVRDALRSGKTLAGLRAGHRQRRRPARLAGAFGRRNLQCVERERRNGVSISASSAAR